MRAGLSTIQQTLTPEAASVLNHSIAEAGRRNHGQTTPLHVAATLLASPSGFLRQACIRSHPNSSHPLQCRALELCFSVALERLPTAQNMAPGMEPPISNALMAALKRAQAHQRRGCPEQQQQPLLAVKVELEQLIISILDDPSVSRVMREASFSSPAVKATIEQSLNSNAQAHHAHHHHHQICNGGNLNLGAGFGGIAPRMLSTPAQLSTPTTPTPSPVVPLGNRNVYLNPRLQHTGMGQMGNHRSEEVKKVLDILMRTKKKNPVLVGDSEPETVVKELLRKIENKELSNEEPLKNVQVIALEKDFLSDKNQIPAKIKELIGLIESKIESGRIILDLGDLKWLVEQPVNFGQQNHQQQQVVTEVARAAVLEMGKLVERFGGGDNKLWLIGTATCETYLRCQFYHSSMENDWDLQAVPITSRSPLPGMFPRLASERILGNPIESLNPLKSALSPPPSLTRRFPENSDSVHKTALCPQCSADYDKEVAKLVAIQKSLSEAKMEATGPSLPQWLQNAKLNSRDAKAADQAQVKDEELLPKQKTQELQKKWRDTCLHLHLNFHRNINSDKTASSSLPMSGLYGPNLFGRQPFQPMLSTNKPLGEGLQLNMSQPKLPAMKPLGESLRLNTSQPKLQPTKSLGEALQLNTSQVTSPSSERASSPRSPVRTDLVLGRKGTESTPEKTEDHVKDLLGCISSEQTKLIDKFASKLDADSYKKLLKGFMEKAWWQAEAASAVASAITRCRLGNGKRRGAGSRGDIWLLFAGPDRVGKRKIASVLADQICGTSPIIISLVSRRDYEEPDTNFRGKTAIDRIAEAVRRNPFSVIMLEDIDEVDMLIRERIKQAIERGRLADSHGREINLGSSVFILTGNWSEVPKDGNFIDEKKLASIASGNWQLRLIASTKRRPNWLQTEERKTKPRKETGSGLSFDLNLAADTDDDRTDGSHNSSDLTVDHEDELGLENRHFSIASVSHELVSNVNDLIVFKPVDFAFVRGEIKKTISVRFSMVINEDVSIEVEDDAVEKILGGLWHDRTSLESWIERVLAPSFEQLKPRLPSGEGNSSIVRLVVDPETDTNSGSNGDWLPSRIALEA